jgi:hypothetical protein
MNKKEKLKKLLESREKTITRLKKVKERIGEEKENEEAWPGHENTNYHDDLNQYEMLSTHLDEIEKGIAELT